MSLRQIRVNGRKGGQARVTVGVPTDTTLPAQLDALPARTWELAQAVERLAGAGKSPRARNRSGPPWTQENEATESQTCASQT